MPKTQWQYLHQSHDQHTDYINTWLDSSQATAYKADTTNSLRTVINYRLVCCHNPVLFMDKGFCWGLHLSLAILILSLIQTQVGAMQYDATTQCIVSNGSYRPCYTRTCSIVIHSQVMQRSGTCQQLTTDPIPFCCCFILHSLF